jgi:hypothetical protein
MCRMEGFVAQPAALSLALVLRRLQPTTTNLFLHPQNPGYLRIYVGYFSLLAHSLCSLHKQRFHIHRYDHDKGCYCHLQMFDDQNRLYRLALAIKGQLDYRRPHRSFCLESPPNRCRILLYRSSAPPRKRLSPHNHIDSLQHQIP